MRVQATNVPTALRAAMVAALLVGVSACSGGASATATTVVTPNIPRSTLSSTAPSGGGSAAPTTDAQTGAAITVDAPQQLALLQQKAGCAAAIGPLYSAVLNGTSTEPQVLAATPVSAQTSMKTAFDELNQIIAADPNYKTDGNASKPKKVLDDFCYTPAGAALVGTTPADALKPPKPVKPAPTPKRTTGH